MGFLGEIRKLLFGVKSVTKSGAGKVADKSQELGEELLERGSKAYTKGKDVAEDAVENASDKFSDIVEKAKDKISDISDLVSVNETVDKAADFTEDVGKKVLAQGSKAASSTIEFAEKVGKKVMDVGGDAIEKAGDVSEKVGEKMLDAKDKLMDRAQEVSDKISDKFDETYEKAKKLEAEEALEGDSKYADKPIDIDESLLEDSDDFFAKAEKYAEGNYSGKADKVKFDQETDEMTKELKVGETTISLPEGDKQKKEMAKAAGFEDLDGDGNEVVDDAIIVEDDVVGPVDKAVTDIKDQSTDVEGIAKDAADQVQSEVNKKVEEMGEMMDKALGEEE